MLFLPPPEKIPMFGYWRLGNELYRYLRKDGIMKLFAMFETEEDAIVARMLFVNNETYIPYEEVYGIPHEEAVARYIENYSKAYQHGYG